LKKEKNVFTEKVCVRVFFKFLIKIFRSLFFYIGNIINKNYIVEMLESKPSYKTLQPALSAEVLTKQTNEQRFWRKYENVNITPGGGIVSTVCSNGNDGNILVFGQGRSVHIYDEGKIVRSMNNFDLGVTAATIRWDGKMIAVGDESGKIEVMDTK
jgi:hypothetical protein